MSVTPPSTPSPPWEVLHLLAHHLDPKTLAIASCVCKSWLISFSADQIWQPICTGHYPCLSNLKLITNYDPSNIPFHRLYALGYSASKRRLKQPPKPIISLDTLIFTIDIRVKNSKVPFVAIAKPVNELDVDQNEVFKFEVEVDNDINCECLGLSNDISELECVKISWNVVLKGWGGAFTMMDCEGKLMCLSEGGGEGWFSEDLPSPECCRGDHVGSGIVADMKVVLCGGGGGIKKVKKVSLGMLSIANWRYVNVEEGLRYLQHFLLPTKDILSIEY